MAAQVQMVEVVRVAAHPWPVGQRRARVVDEGREHVRTIVRTLWRRGQGARRVRTHVVALVEGPLAHLQLHGEALDRVLDAIRVVQNVVRHRRAVGSDGHGQHWPRERSLTIADGSALVLEGV